MNRPYKMPSVVGGRGGTKGRDVLHHQSLSTQLCLLSWNRTAPTAACFWSEHPPHPPPLKKNIIYNRPRQWRTRPRFFTVQNRAWNFKIHRSTGPQLFEERLYIERVFWKEPLEWCWGGAEKWIPGLYVAGQIREINVLASIAASLQPHFLGPVASMSRGWKGTLLKFGGEVGEGRVQPEDTFSVPLGSFQSGCPTSPNRWPGSRSVREPSGSVFAENTLDQSSNRRKEKSPNSRALRADTDRDVW